MTENQPNPPESAQPQPQAPAPQASDAPAAKGLQPQKPSLLKTLSINTLRGTIGVLEKAVAKLEAPPPAQPQPSVLDKVRPVLLSLWNGWVVVLDTIRSFLPASLSQKLPNWGLTGTIAGLLALVIWTGSALFSEKPPEVAKLPTGGVPTPPELSAPSAPVPVEPVPEPTPELTPEQRLIASIQQQVTEVTTEYAEGLIQSIEANFQGSLLVVKVSDDWYNLKNGRQDKLAKEMLQRAKDLDFSRLKITDSQSIVVARSPVIGPDMVILKRRVTSPESLAS
ncbi:hypothetical protein [Microcoleus sp. FACHB-68]|uniref:hypothetical protein n=1 Tax=Microcoleus sp. FACHB-68 TaxID=2692826 RepID=UPI001687E6F3|nr:hypothetical protein [Microcoleus sp. FACHB-68]MBD1939832.1 hypothetical protein [Microcoleus sp. FACHB-68]